MNTTTRLLWQAGLGSVLAAVAFAAAASAPRVSTSLMVVCLSVFVTGLALLEAALMQAIDRSDDRAPAANVRPSATTA